MVLKTGTYATQLMVQAEHTRRDTGASGSKTDPARGLGKARPSQSRGQAPLASKQSSGTQLRRPPSELTNSNMQAEFRPPHRRCRVFEQYEAPLPVSSSPGENYHFRAHLVNQQVVVFHPEHVRRIHNQASSTRQISIKVSFFFFKEEDLNSTFISMNIPYRIMGTCTTLL